MKKHLNAVAIITLVILMPMVVLSAYEFLVGDLTFSEYTAMWKETLLLLIGFWIRGATSGDSGGEGGSSGGV